MMMVMMVMVMTMSLKVAPRKVQDYHVLNAKHKNVPTNIPLVASTILWTGKRFSRRRQSDERTL
jgi:hypothetical protein